MMVDNEMIVELESLLAKEDVDDFYEITVSCSYCDWETTVESYTELVLESYTHSHNAPIYSYDITVVPEYMVDITISV